MHYSVETGELAILAQCRIHSRFPSQVYILSCKVIRTGNPLNGNSNVMLLYSIKLTHTNLCLLLKNSDNTGSYTGHHF